MKRKKGRGAAPPGKRAHTDDESVGAQTSLHVLADIAMQKASEETSVSDAEMDMPDVEAYSPETERDKSVQETLASQPYVYAFESADARRKFLCGVPLLKRHTLSKDTGYFGEPTTNSAANPSKKVGYFGEPLAIPSVSLVDTYAQQVHSSKNTRGGGLRISDAVISELTELQHRAGWEEQNGKMVVCWKINQANFDFI